MLHLSLPYTAAESPSKTAAILPVIAVASGLLALLLGNGWLALIGLFAALLMALQERVHPQPLPRTKAPFEQAPLPDGGTSTGIASLWRRDRA